ncbi:cell division protein SepF [Pseudofrankia asymbiotica]|uniref:Cell division protein SepF n=1 Tax=Pseudofrankia asymbiotica TaxID=1834516 RepID=A0A1V2IJW1_9ACTN|nr:cell division protein SepF [Pseudofrankia asymbiotica]ONH32746.1 hypothetical protein BL253_02995 [Pseudofrankia asymbiotica]
MTVAVEPADGAPVFVIHEYRDVAPAARDVRTSGAVIVDVRPADDEARRRVVDFLAGVGFGIGTSPLRLAEGVYFLSGERTPTRSEHERFRP